MERTLGAPNLRPSEILAERRKEALEIARSHKVTNVRVFGSAVRGEETPDSDIDLLVDREPGATPFDLSALRMDLVELVVVELDVVPSGASGHPMDRIISEAVPH